MKLTLDWLRDFVDLPTDDPEVIAETFNQLGFEVEEMTPLLPNFRGVVVGRVLEILPHPNADKVRLCVVDTGTASHEIVCGAWNFDEGAVVPVALPGAMLGDFEIGRRKIRGVVSNGMICSETELGLGDDAAGIMVLNDEFPDAELGTDLVSLFPATDAFFDIEVNPNRPDAMSVIGLARELAAQFDTTFREAARGLLGGGPPTGTSVTIEDREACPRFVARAVRNVTVGPSPRWMRARLAAAGQRPISNVVDATNYAMLELGHPTHAFDGDLLGDTIVVRRAQKGEVLTTLDGVDRELVPSDIVVSDGVRPVALAGVMGGGDTEVHEQTTTVLIEAAHWDPPSILLTSKRLGLRSEASSRFERGMDPNFCDIAADRVAELLAVTAGGEVASDRTDAYPVLIEPAELTLAMSDISRTLGVEIGVEATTSYLGRLGFGVEGSGPLTVRVPTRRPDVVRPVDLVEEVARLYGYDNIPERVATGTGGGLPRSERMLRSLRRLMVGAGYHETLQFSFIGTEDLDNLDLAEADPRRRGVRVVNPLRDEEGVMRTTLLPGLLKAAATNQARQIESASLFEIGKVFIPGAGKLPEQPENLAFVSIGGREEDWDRAARPVDVRDAIGLWDLLAEELRLPGPSRAAVGDPPYHPGRAAEVSIREVPIGAVGEIHPSVARKFGLRGRVVVGEIELASLLAARDDWAFEPPSPYPPSIFDLAFELDATTPASVVVEAIEAAAGEVLEQQRVFDVFTGDPLPEGRKSLAINLTLRHPERTLSDEEVAPIRRLIVERVETDANATLRGEL